MIPTEIAALINLIGAPAVFVLLLILRDWMQGKSTSKQENAITDLAVDSNAERKERQAVIDELQKSNNHLQAEVFKIQLKQSEEAGRRDEIRLTNDKNEAKIVRLEIRIIELEKHREQSTLRITELENQIAELEKKLATANVENDILQSQKRELETLLTYERNRADTLNDLVTQIRAVDTTGGGKTIPIPELQAIDVDDTIHPLPDVPASSTPDNPQPDSGVNAA
jgi:predicted RNase H-like nuclease (RuvC/YqgF family)